jgi:hypothetical protein
MSTPQPIYDLCRLLVSSSIATSNPHSALTASEASGERKEGEGMKDWLIALWYRLTYCSKHGHVYKCCDYCLNCGRARW